MIKKKLPIGIDDFKKIREKNFYYVDKTKLIEQLLENWGEVNLFTRPRRFGKTLNMSMLKSFFEIGTDPSLFDDLYISSNKKLCEEHMGKYPVIFLSLKSVEGSAFGEALHNFMNVIVHEAKRFSFLQESVRLDDYDKRTYHNLCFPSDLNNTIAQVNLEHSLKKLSDLLYQHFEKKTIILIDDYDTPLQHAFENGYYQEMLSCLNLFLGSALKTNDSLQFAVLTGCSQFPNESCISGFNNARVFSILDTRFEEQFGFTNDEVKKLLAEYDLEDSNQEIKEWYGGYHFGRVDIYFPMSVICYVNDLKKNPNVSPKTYRMRDVGMDLMRIFIENADATTKEEIEELLSEKSIPKDIRIYISYKDFIEHIWSALLITGCLTLKQTEDRNIFKLSIPNREIKDIFIQFIQDWFQNLIGEESLLTRQIVDGLVHGEADMVENSLILMLCKSISTLDINASVEKTERYYFNFFEEILKNLNQELNICNADNILKIDYKTSEIMINIKSTKDMKSIDEMSEKALEQINEKVDSELRQVKDKNKLLIYGIAFCRKRCKIAVERL